MSGLADQIAAAESRSARLLLMARVYAALALSMLLVWPFIEPQLPEAWQLASDLAIPIVIACGAVAVVRAARLAIVRGEEAKRLHAELESRRDELSSLYNVGYLREELRSLIAGCARDESTFALVALDLDNFKEINERFGHTAGDELIGAIGRAIGEALGEDGIAARPAGDEFALLLPGASRGDARRVAERVAKAIHRASVGALAQNTHVAITASYGIAVYPADGGDAEALTSSAYRELHRMKVQVLGEHLRTSERNSQDVFFAIGEAIGRSLDPQETVRNFCRAVGQSLGVDSCGVWFIEESGLISFLAGYAPDPAWSRRAGAMSELAPMTESEARAIGLLRPQPVYLDDVASSPAMPERFREHAQPGAWFICAPVPGTRGIIVMSCRHEQAAPPDTGLVLAIARHAASALSNAEAYQRATRGREQLAALAGLGGLLIGDGDFEARLGQVVSRIIEVTGFDTVTIDTGDPTGERTFIRSFHGRRPDGEPWSDRETHLWRVMRPALTDPAIAGFLREANRPIVMDDPVRQVPEIYREIIAVSGIRTVVVMPILWQDELKGLLYFSSYREQGFDQQDIALMQTIASQLAPALQVASLHRELEHSYADLKDAHLQALLRLAYAAEARDPYTECHLQRIRGIAQAIAHRLGVSGDELEALGYGAVVHDLGKLRIPDSILTNPGLLSDDEWAQMKKHPEWGAEIIGSNPFYDVARQVALNHHERWDGSGYPSGLAGEQIPLAARVVSVADVYDALTSARPYKAAWASERALIELMRMRGKTLCPTAVDTFMELWREGEISRIDAETMDDSMELDFRGLYAA